MAPFNIRTLPKCFIIHKTTFITIKRTLRNNMKNIFYTIGVTVSASPVTPEIRSG